MLEKNNGIEKLILNSVNVGDEVLSFFFSIKMCSESLCGRLSFHCRTANPSAWGVFDIKVCREPEPLQKC